MSERPGIVKVRIRDGAYLAHLVYEGWTFSSQPVCTFCAEVYHKSNLIAVRGSDPMPICKRCNTSVGRMAKADIRREVVDGDIDN